MMFLQWSHMAWSMRFIDRALSALSDSQSSYVYDWAAVRSTTLSAPTGGSVGSWKDFCHVEHLLMLSASSRLTDTVPAISSRLAHADSVGMCSDACCANMAGFPPSQSAGALLTSVGMCSDACCATWPGLQ